MSSFATPLLYLNMGGEMLYVLRQRLKAQRVSVDKTIQVLDDVVAALLNPEILSSMFEEKSLTKLSILKSTLESVALCSIMKLDKNSMNKLFDLMIMMVKYQLTAATGPVEIILLTLNHIDAMRVMASYPNAQQSTELVHQMVIDFYGPLTFEEIWNARSICLRELGPYCVRVSILLNLGLQNDDGSFTVRVTFPDKNSGRYDEKYEENKDRLSGLRLCDVDLKTYCNSSFSLFGERSTLLGKNMYSMPHEVAKRTSKEENDNYLQDRGTRAELGMLAVQLGTEETSYKRPFTLNLLSKEDNDSANVKETETDFKNDSQADATTTKHEKTKFNDAYKTKLDNICADFDDKLEEINHSIELLELFDETE